MRTLVEAIAYFVGQAGLLAAVFFGTNLRVENPVVFFGGIALGVLSAVVVWLARRGR